MLFFLDSAREIFPSTVGWFGLNTALMVPAEPAPVEYNYSAVLK